MIAYDKVLLVSWAVTKLSVCLLTFPRASIAACTATVRLQSFSLKIKLSFHSLAYDVVEALPLLTSWLSVRHTLRRLVPSDL